MKFSSLQQVVFFFSVNQVDRLLFVKHLSTMVKSGIHVAEAIGALAEETLNPALHRILIKIQHDVDNGQPLHRALEKHPLFLDAISRHIIRVGEESGTLEQNLEYLTLQLKHKRETRMKVESALLYPELIFMTAALVGAGVSFFILPRLGDLFRQLDTTLPLSTKILLFLSDVMRDYGALILGGFFLGLIILRWLLHTASLKPRWHAFQLSLPYFGPLLRDYELTSLFRNIGIMLKSGLPLVPSLEAQRENTENEVFRWYLLHIQQGVEQGKKIAEVLEREKLRHFPVIASKMIAVGEESGRLEESLLYLADFFEEEAENTARNFTNILEPAMLLVVGIVVAFVALAIISPIYSLSGSIRPR